MNFEKIFKNPRAKMMQVFHQDGVIDLIAGAVLLNLGFDLLNQSSMTSLFTYIPILLMTPMKMQMTIARLGYEPFNNDQKKVRQWMTITAAVMIFTLLILGLILMNSSSSVPMWLASRLGENSSIISASVVLTIIFLAAAFQIPLKRFLLYAGVVLLIALLTMLFSWPVHMMIFAISVLMMAFGIRLMFIFSRAYPQETPKKNKKA